MHSAVTYENTVFVMGGQYNGGYLNSCECYDITKDEWTTVSPMKKAKRYFGATVVNNQYIYTFGGFNITDGEIDVIERYNISEDTWQLLDIRLDSSNFLCACFSPEPDKVVVLGG